MSNPFRHIRSVIDDLNRSLAIYDGFTSQILKSTSAITAIQASLAAQRAIDRDLIASATSALSAVRLPDFTSNLGDLVSANRALTDIISQSAITDSALSKAFAEHNVLRNSLASIATLPSATDLLSSLDTTRLLHTSLSNQYRLPDLEAHSFGSLIDASNVLSSDLAATFSKLTRSYRDVIEAIPIIPQNFVPFIANYSPIEYSLELDVLESISVERDEEADVEPLPSVDDELASFDSRLLTLLNGARESLNSDNPEKARHVTTSVRELFTHMLHGLAPDAEIRKWSTEAGHYHDNRPTRRARLLYICRTLSCDPLTKFIQDDVRAALALMDSLNAGTHVVQSKLTQFQLQAIVYRMESLALFLLKVSRGDT
jgi:hypothetical protein